MGYIQNDKHVGIDVCCMCLDEQIETGINTHPEWWGEPDGSLSPQYRELFNALYRGKDVPCAIWVGCLDDSIDVAVCAKHLAKAMYELQEFIEHENR